MYIPSFAGGCGARAVVAARRQRHRGKRRLIGDPE
tara:strand:- start:249 stop:353 length:105 start_codon:yes stop_codon:yes gene_type:complete